MNLAFNNSNIDHICVSTKDKIFNILGPVIQIDEPIQNITEDIQMKKMHNMDSAIYIDGHYEHITVAKFKKNKNTKIFMNIDHALSNTD
jgi:hypothetical protein